MSQNHHYSSQARAYRESRGMFRGRSRAYPVPRAPRQIPAPLGTLLSSSKVDDWSFEMCSLDQARITDQKVTSTYNLLSKSSTTIMVPGAPPLYTPLPQPRQLKDDAGGEYFREENAARFPAHAMEPAVKSLFINQPAFDASTVDIFACGSSLGNLVRLMLSENQDFSLVIHIVGNTAFFLRREQSPSELIEDVVGFGHAFPEAYTTWEADVKRSTSHHRVLAYNFGGLKFLVRFESDGYIRDGRTDTGSTTDSATARPIDELLTDLLAENPASSPAEHGVEHRGHSVDQSSVFDLKTRSIRKVDEDIVEGELPRLWVRQIAKFILAFHRSGTFEDIRVQDVKSKVLKWETASAPALRRLAGLIRKIVTTANEQPNGKVEVRSSRAGCFAFHTVDEDGWDALPPSLTKTWLVSGSKSQDEEGMKRSGSRGSSTSDQRPGDMSGEDDYDEEEHYCRDDTSDGSLDYTACSAEDCGYCGRCSY
nr:hypothetical protein CFP56_01119 [Quercus suber]